MKKGFTLIELLAVIIILAIVALIATPIILNVISDARISAGRSEASMIYSGINNYCVTADMQNQLTGELNICADGVTTEEVSQMVNLGNAKVEEVSYSNGKVTNLVIESNNHKFTLCGDGSFAMDDEECGVTPPDVAITTGPLIDILMQQYQEGNETGLVQDETNPNIYYYTGTNEQVSNNHLWYGGHHWRVVEIDTDADTLLLVSQQPLTAIQPASTVWDTQEEYENSYINTWLNDYFYNSLASSIQNKIVENTFNVGIYNDVDEITTSQNVGLLDETQYTRAGGTDSYLDIKDFFLLGNRYDSSDVRYVNNDGSLVDDSPTWANGVRAVIKISNITVTGGDGTLTSNYVASDKATNTNDVQVGEYINVPYSGNDNACGSDNMCTFRVVSKDNDSIKVVLNGLLNKTSKYGLPVTITTENTIYESLKKFVNNIDDSYKYSGNKKFYIGYYPMPDSDDEQIGYDYNNIKNEYLETNVGLVTIGEMFSSNDIDLSTSSIKEFVDVNTIENSTVSNNYWTMNRFGGDPFEDYYAMIGAVHYVYGTGTVGGNLWPLDDPEHEESYNLGVRPTLYLKNNLEFIGGNGTAQLPYTLQ